MGRAARWLVATGVTLGTFAVFLWLSGAFVLPLWIKSGADRWVIATGVGLAMAALAALWGVSFARREQQGAQSVPDTRPPDVVMEAEASDSGRINQAGRNQTFGAQSEQQRNNEIDASRPASFHMKAKASGRAQVNQAGRDQTFDKR
jgi:hypothetical protein